LIVLDSVNGFYYQLAVDRKAKSVKAIDVQLSRRQYH